VPLHAAPTAAGRRSRWFWGTYTGYCCAFLQLCGLRRRTAGDASARMGCSLLGCWLLGARPPDPNSQQPNTLTALPQALLDADHRGAGADHGQPVDGPDGAAQGPLGDIVGADYHRHHPAVLALA